MASFDIAPLFVFIASIFASMIPFLLFSFKKIYLCTDQYNDVMANLLLLGFVPSGSEWTIILLVILLLFDGEKIPELMWGLGKRVKSFKESVNEAKEEISRAKNEIGEPSDTEKKDK